MRLKELILCSKKVDFLFGLYLKSCIIICEQLRSQMLMVYFGVKCFPPCNLWLGKVFRRTG